VRILLTVHHKLTPDSGAAGSTLHLAQCYERLGHQTALASFSDLPGALSEQAAAVVFPWFVAGRMSRAWRRWRPDVIDATTGDAWIVGRSGACRRGGAALVTRSTGLEHAVHAEYLAEAAAGRLALSRRYAIYHGGWRLREVASSLRTADRACFLNGFDRDLAVRELGVRANRARVVRNGIPEHLLGLPRPPARRRREGLRVAVVGTFSVRKGADFGIAALARFLAADGRRRVSYLGAGVEDSEILSGFPEPVRARVQSQQHYELRQLPALLADHNVCVFPSLVEGFGKTLLEAMACGLAAVAADSPGPRSFMRPEVDGIFVPRRSSDAIVAALERLDADRDRLLWMQNGAYDRAQSFGWATVGDERLSIYREAIDAARARSAGRERDS